MSIKLQPEVSRIMIEVAKGLLNPDAHVPFSKRDKSLGDRSKYIGASSAVGCLYKSYMDVKHPVETISPKQVFVFERGHQLEEMVRKGLNGRGWKEVDEIPENFEKKTFIHQYELQGTGYFSFLKPHLDFVFIGKSELVIKEFKSSATIPGTPYESHIKQSLLQKRLLQDRFPNKKIRAAIVYHNWDTGDSVEFTTHDNEDLLVEAFKSAKRLWMAMESNIAPAPERQLYCTTCPHKDTCPALCIAGGEELPKDLHPQARELVLHRERDKEIKRDKKLLISYMKACGMKVGKLPMNKKDIYKFEIGFVQGKKMVSAEKLKIEHKAIYDALAEDVNSYEFLRIT